MFLFLTRVKPGAKPDIRRSSFPRSHLFTQASPPVSFSVPRNTLAVAVCDLLLLTFSLLLTTPPSLHPASPPRHLHMAHKQPCAKYEYVVTPSGPKILPVSEAYSKYEESPADYNAGGYLQIKVKDTFKDGRYTVLRKLGCVIVLCLWRITRIPLLRRDSPSPLSMR